MLTIKLAFRNTLRNKRRTFLASLAIGIGLAGLIFVDAVYLGMSENMIKLATSTFMGDAQITHRDFRDTFDGKYKLEHKQNIIKELEKESIVKTYSLRVASFAMISSSSDASSIILYGINPETEKNTSKIKDAVIYGNYLQSDNPHSIIVGEKLSKKLETEIGDRIVITSSNTKTDEIAQSMFIVEGIYKFGNNHMDSSMAFVNIKQAQSLFGLEDGVNEIVIKFTNLHIALDKTLPFWKKYSKGTNVAEDWDEIFSE
ncbi:MAG TPA: ABC transporter permease, partial [Elusimicrobiales bacterium]|nr:ABC transporter permease [Elusimicrobiales bacterium]